MAIPSRTSGVRLADVVGALSLASDFGLGQPFAHAPQSSIVAMRLAELLPLNDAERRTVYYASLLHMIATGRGAAR